MVSTQTNTNQSPGRPKTKLRAKRTKRRIGRRMGTAPSDSKSSLENTEPQPPSSRSEHKSDDVVLEPKMKKRSLSEERQPSRVKMGQRSSSLQLDSSHVSQPSLRVAPSGLARRQQQAHPKRKAWFFPWPARFVPSRVTIEDEGFDSFHGNNSSSSDFENDESAKPENRAQSNPLGVVGLSDIKKCEELECRNSNLKFDEQTSESVSDNVSTNNSTGDQGNRFN